MKILILSQRYHPFVGGVETQTRLIANELAKTHSVTVAAVNFGIPDVHPKLHVLTESILIPEFESYQDGDVPVVALSPTRGQRLAMLPIGIRAVPVLRSRFYRPLLNFGYRWYKAAFMSRLRELVRDVDVVHSAAGGYLGWAAQAAAIAEGKPFACTPYVHPGQHGDDPASIAYYKKANAVFALLETDKKLLSEFGVDPNKIHLSGVVPLLPETADPSGFRERHGIGNAPVILFVGRMVGYKGYSAILDSAPEIWKQFPDARFVFIGPGANPHSSEFEDPEGRILCLGKVSEQEKADALSACTVFAMPSKFEILPAVYLESWSYGKPVIGGTANGLKELVEGNGAGVVSTQDPIELSAKVCSLLADPEGTAAMGQRGKALVEERYNTESVVRAIESVYEAIAAGK